MSRLRRIKNWVKENPETAAYFVMCGVAGVVIGRQRGQITRVQNQADWYARELNNIVEPMREGYAARLDFSGNRVIFFESAPRALMDQYFGPK